MDLMSVRSLLECGHYANPSAFVADIRLAFSNALRACGKEGEEAAMVENLLTIASRCAVFRDEMERADADALAKQHLIEAKKPPDMVRSFADLWKGASVRSCSAQKDDAVHAFPAWRFLMWLVSSRVLQSCNVMRTAALACLCPHR